MTLFDEHGNKTAIPNKERQIEALQLLFLLLPQANRSLLKLLLDLLYHTAKQQDKNKMSAFNLALMFAPHVLWPRHVRFQRAGLRWSGTHRGSIPCALFPVISNFWDAASHHILYTVTLTSCWWNLKVNLFFFDVQTSLKSFLTHVLSCSRWQLLTWKTIWRNWTTAWHSSSNTRRNSSGWLFNTHKQSGLIWSLKRLRLKVKNRSSRGWATCLLCVVQAPVYLRDYARVHFTGTKALQTKVSEHTTLRWPLIYRLVD